MTNKKAIEILTNESKCLNSDDDLCVVGICDGCEYNVERAELTDALEIAVKAMENQMEALKNSPTQMSGTSDLISKEKMKHISYNFWDDKISRDYVHMFMEVIDELPSAQPEQQWIPCSERLPEIDEEVLVCYDFKRHRSVYIANFYGDGEFHGYDDEYFTPDGRKHRKAVAWMPLPEPYREGKKNDN